MTVTRPKLDRSFCPLPLIINSFYNQVSHFRQFFHNNTYYHEMLYFIDKDICTHNHTFINTCGNLKTHFTACINLMLIYDCEKS